MPYQRSIKTVEELRVLCQRFEQMWEQTGYDPRRFNEASIPRRRIVNELSHELERMKIASTINLENCVSHNHIYNQNDVDGEGINAFRKTQSNSDSANVKIICWNCKDLGHRYQDCQEEFLDVFCFGCGAANVRKPNCQACQVKKAAENYRPGVNMARGSRYGGNSTQQPGLRDPNSKPSE